MKRALMAGVFFLAAPLLAAPVPVRPPGPPSWSMPWGVVDGAGRVGFATNEKGGIDAFNLATGKALWSSSEATKPLAVHDGRLLAQAPEKGKANAVRIVALDVKSGKRLSRSDAVTFPDWVSVDLSYGRSFQSEGRVEQGALWLGWAARGWYAGGARPTPDVERRARKSAEGVARINLGTGKVEMLAADKMPVPKIKLPPGAEKDAVRRAWAPGGTRGLPQVTDKYAVAVALTPQGADRRAVLKRWELVTGKALPPVELMSSRYVRVELSADCRTVLVMAIGANRPATGGPEWSAFSTETGKLLTKFKQESGTTTVSALGGRAYCVVQLPGKPGAVGISGPRALKAIDLKTGMLAWERPIEPYRYLLPPP
jgi:hypothetical protein